MVSSLAFYLVFGKPLIMYGGIFTFVLMLFTALVAVLNAKGINTIPFKWHPKLAAATIVLGFIHAIFGLSVYFNF